MEFGGQQIIMLPIFFRISHENLGYLANFRLFRTNSHDNLSDFRSEPPKETKITQKLYLK